MTDRNLMYSHSPRMKMLFHSMYSMPTPPVQPATKSLVLSCVMLVVCDGTGNTVPITVVVWPSAFVVVMSSRRFVVVVTLRWTSMRPTATPPNIYGRKSLTAQPTRPLIVIASLIWTVALPLTVTKKLGVSFTGVNCPGGKLYWIGPIVDEEEPVRLSMYW